MQLETVSTVGQCIQVTVISPRLHVVNDVLTASAAGRQSSRHVALLSFPGAFVTAPTPRDVYLIIDVRSDEPGCT